jgi:hypothetical protein
VAGTITLTVDGGTSAPLSLSIEAGTLTLAGQAVGVSTDSEIGTVEGNLFNSDFESGSLSDSITLNLDGNYSEFTWANDVGQEGGGTITLVQDEWDSPTSGQGGRIIWAGGASGSTQNTFVSGKDWQAKASDQYTKRKALRVHYEPGEGWAEIRFAMASGYAAPTLWLRWWARIPTNYAAPDGQPKYLAVWMDDYSSGGDGSTVWLSPSETAASGEMGLTYSEGRNQTSGYDYTEAAYFHETNDRGRWLQLCMRLIAESSADAEDGSITTWARWQEDTAWTQKQSMTGLLLRIPSSGPQGWCRGYLGGYQNPSGYSSATDWLWDDFTLGTSDLR